MLKKPSAPVLPATARPPSSGAMEVESTRVHTLADGKKLIDVTLRRPDKQSVLVVPEFEDESDESSSSEDEDGGGAPVYSSPIRRPQSSRHYHLHDVGSENDNNNNNSESITQDEYQQQQPAAAQCEFKWDASSVNDIQQLTNANAQLVAQVSDFKGQIKSLQIQLEALAPVPGLNPEMVQDILLEREGGSEHDIRDTKIVHQAKTLRHLKRTLQREKQLAVDATKQCKLLEAAKQMLERENETLRLKAARFQARASAAASASALAQAGPALQDETQSEHASQSSTTSSSSGEAAQQVRKKLEDLKSKHDKLQLDFKKLHRALQREVGDDVPLEEILDGAGDLNGGKRGRAQQIVMLRAKVKKLELELIRAGSGGSSDLVAGSLALPSNNVDVRAQHELAGQQAQKQRLVDKLTLERDEVQTQLAQVTKKYEAVKSRSQTLEKDKQESKTKFQLLVDKSKNDDALIDALQRQLETWKTKVQEVRRVRTAESVSSSSQKDDRNAELERLRSIVAEYKRQGGGVLLPSSQGPQPSSLSIATSMPVPSEASQFRTMAAEKERLQEVVKALQSQLDEKERQLRQLKQQPPPPVMMPVEDASLISRIPRKPGMPALGRVGSNSSGPSQLNQQQSGGDSMHGAEMEALRRTFRESLRAKENEIAALTNRLHELQEAQKQQRNQETSPRIDGSIGGGGGSSSDDMALEVQDLQEENAFLRQEFEKLKTRYEVLARNAKTSSTSGSSKAK